MTRGERLQQVFDHRPQPPYNLEMVRTACAYLPDCEMDEILPVRSSENHAQLSGFVEQFVGAQIAFADISQHAMELVYRQHGCGRIIDRRRQRLQRNVDNNAKCKGRILLHSALRPERDRCPQSLFGDHLCAAIKVEQGFINGDKIAMSSFERSASAINWPRF